MDHQVEVEVEGRRPKRDGPSWRGNLELSRHQVEDGRKVVVGCPPLGRHGASTISTSPALLSRGDRLSLPWFRLGTAPFNTYIHTHTHYQYNHTDHHHAVCFLDDLFTGGFKHGTCMPSCHIALVLTLAGSSRRRETEQAGRRTPRHIRPNTRAVPMRTSYLPARNKWLNVLSEPSCIFAAPF